MYTTSKKILLTALTTILFSQLVEAQQFAGFQQTDFGTIGNVYQPGFIVRPESGTRVNALSVSSWLGNNAYKIRKGYLLSTTTDDAIEGKDYIKNSGNRVRKGGFNVDYIGPSATFHYEGYNIGFYTRVRQIGKVTNVSDNVLQMLGDVNNNFYGRNINEQNLRVDFHSFGEIGIQYGRGMLVNHKHVIAAGATFKYLLGISAGTYYSNNLNINIENENHINTLNGDIKALYSRNVEEFGDAGLDVWENLGDRSGKLAFGLDFGILYELRPNSNHINYTPYKVRAALSVTDIGRILYHSASASQEYTFNADNRSTDDISIKLNEGLNDYLARMDSAGILQTTYLIEDFRVKLPMALRGNLDFKIYKGAYLNGNMIINLVSTAADINGPGYISTFTIAPRYETKLWSAGLPFTFNSAGNIGLGLNARIGPLFIGSSSIFTALFNKEISHADAYAGLQWTFLSKRKVTDPDVF